MGAGLGLETCGRLRLTTVTLRPLFVMKSFAGSRLPDLKLSTGLGVGATGLGVGANDWKVGADVTGLCATGLGLGVTAMDGSTNVRPSPLGMKPNSGAAPYSTSRKSPVGS